MASKAKSMKVTVPNIEKVLKAAGFQRSNLNSVGEVRTTGFVVKEQFEGNRRALYTYWQWVKEDAEEKPYQQEMTEYLARSAPWDAKYADALRKHFSLRLMVVPMPHTDLEVPLWIIEPLDPALDTPESEKSA